MSPLSPVFLHGGAVTGVAAIAVLAGLAVFVFVLAYVLSALQRDGARSQHARSNTRSRR